MSFKYNVHKLSNNHYVLPQVSGMKVDVHAFLSEKLYESSEEEMWEQIVNGASHDGVTGAYLMPDCHKGFGVPVGSVIVTDGTLIQSGSGYDISCGVLYMRVPGLTAADVVDKAVRRRWVQEVEKRVATGIGSHRTEGMRSFSSSKIEEVLHHGAKALGIVTDLCERQFIPVSKDLNIHRIEEAYGKALPQLGSLGGGNHFIEMQVSEAGTVWVMIHTGSRGYGHKTADHYFTEGAKLRGLPHGRREESWLHINEDLGQEFWDHHNSAANYAVANRYAIAQSIQGALQEVFKLSGEYLYDISHNLIQEETLVLPDGSHKKGFVHRKGATRAFPGGHPDLKGTRWFDTGHPVLVPGSMYDGAAIMFPFEGAYKTACSVNHGSGRLMGRNAAKRSLGSVQEIVDSEMADVKRTFNGVTIEGIMSNHQKIPLDECRHVYKSLDAVLEVLQEEKITRIADRLWPVANIKGAD
jgi:tRNA-splicing ligase RtcB